MAIAYPVTLTFKLAAFAPRITVNDANGAPILYIQRKALAWKEQERVFESEKQQQELFQIKADRMMSFNARYRFTDTTGRDVGSVQHQGMRSLWKAHFDIFPPGSDTPTHYITEDSPWLKVMDAMLSDVAFVGMFSGYIFTPSYTLHRTSDDKPIFQLKKQPSFFQRSFSIHKLDDQVTGDEEVTLLLGILQAVQIERMNT